MNVIRKMFTDWLVNLSSNPFGNMRLFFAPADTSAGLAKIGPSGNQPEGLCPRISQPFFHGRSPKIILLFPRKNLCLWKCLQARKCLKQVCSVSPQVRRLCNDAN